MSSMVSSISFDLQRKKGYQVIFSLKYSINSHIFTSLRWGSPLNLLLVPAPPSLSRGSDRGGAPMILGFIVSTVVVVVSLIVQYMTEQL